MNNFYLGSEKFIDLGKLKELSFESKILPDYVTSINSQLSVNEDISFEFEANPQLVEK